MKYNIGICDDDINEIQLIKSFLKRFIIECDDSFQISVFKTATELLNTYTESGLFHVLFLDVVMPDLSGLDLAKAIRKLPDKNVIIVFISNYPEYMQESFNIHAFYYMIKPVLYEQFRKIMLRIINETSERNLLKISIGKENYEIVDCNDILYIKSKENTRNTLEIVISNTSYNTKGTITEYSEKLKYTSFFSPTRGYLINLQHIHIISDSTITLDNNTKIPLSRRKKAELHKLFTHNLLSIQQNLY